MGAAPVPARPGPPGSGCRPGRTGPPLGQQLQQAAQAVLEDRARRRRRAAGHFMVGQAQVDQSVVRHQVPQLAQGPQGIRQLLKEADQGQQLILANADLLPRRGRELAGVQRDSRTSQPRELRCAPRPAGARPRVRARPGRGAEAPLLQVGRQVQAGLRRLPGVQDGAAWPSACPGPENRQAHRGQDHQPPSRLGSAGVAQTGHRACRDDPGESLARKGRKGSGHRSQSKPKREVWQQGFMKFSPFAPALFSVGRLCEDDKNINISII